MRISAELSSKEGSIPVYGINILRAFPSLVGETNFQTRTTNSDKKDFVPPNKDKRTQRKLWKEINNKAKESSEFRLDKDNDSPGKKMQHFNANAVRYYIPFIINAGDDTEADGGETVDIRGLTRQREEMIKKIIEAMAGLIRAKTKQTTH
ncbi:hypothetical protein C922_05511 [Plasmodium inui San Antonio 1]|uniref:Uncharacterized protein n=1 Tax=Plasmodium inui San Antonio 1 TaxID=1237626 RepID=W7A4T6_9APIC|nr:hypothetical protein C922_05511 [Plasmodium inui San Antonio 1]EUD64109.1 hypothetical protein C922_05511 [Plasmodium inui San Antonio 1]